MALSMAYHGTNLANNAITTYTTTENNIRGVLVSVEGTTSGQYQVYDHRTSSTVACFSVEYNPGEKKVYIKNVDNSLYGKACNIIVFYE